MGNVTDSRRMTRQEVLEHVYAEALRPGETQARVVQVSVPGREVILAHVIGMPDENILHSLCLDIGFHAGEDFRGESIGILKIFPGEATVIATDIALKYGSIKVGFLDRFSGAVIITGPISEVRSGVEEIVRYFRDELNFTVCPISRQ